MSKENVASEKKRKGAGCLRWMGRVALWGVILLLGLAAIGAIYQGIASARDTKLYKPVDQMVDVDGVQMRLDCRGAGSPTVVLEAGAQSSSIYWVRVQDEVAKFTRVCSYDRAGYGWSDSVHKTIVPEQVADMLHTLLENGGEAPPYLMVGHSFGGIYIRVFTEKHPDEVVGMVLVDSSHEAQGQQAPPELVDDFEKLKTLVSASYLFLRIAEPIGLVRTFKMADAFSSLFSEQEKGAVLAEVYRTGFMGAYTRESEMTSTYSGQPKKLGDMPLIVLSRKMDAQKLLEMYPPDFQSQLTMERWQQEADNVNEMQEELAALSTQGKRVVVEDTGHFIQIDQPQVVIDAIREVFEQVSR
jgi:pimeloyl-ACP methyl ester carboxylesterase